MKCDELKTETIVPQGTAITLQMYPKGEVDAAIAELKDENVKLKRALWMARKAHAVAMFAYWDSHYRDNPNAVYRNRTIDWLRNRWLLILDAIIKKEQEYK